MARFEFVTGYENAGLALPVRKTKHSAGYDLAAAEDVVIPAYHDLLAKLQLNLSDQTEVAAIFEQILFPEIAEHTKDFYTLKEMSTLTGRLKARPTLVPTGIKCKLEPGTYLELSARSSTPLKNWLILSNGVGIIDADYYNNPDNEGHIYLQFINLSSVDIKIKKGEAIGQAIIHRYEITEDDAADGERVGGFGSTTK